MNQWTLTLSAHCASALLSLVCFFSAISVAVADEWSGTDREYLQNLSVTSQGMLQVLEGIDDFWDEGTFGWYIRNIYNTTDDRWIKYFLTGNELGDNSQTPLFRYAGPGTGSSVVNFNDFDQNLQGFLANTLGQFYWRPSSGNSTFETAFKHGTKGNVAQSLGNSYNLFSVWLAEGVRRLLATNQLVATQVDLNRRSVTENLSLILMQLRDMASNSVSQATPEFPQEISVTNQVSIEADAYAPIVESDLAQPVGEVVPESYTAPDSDPLDESEISLDTSGGNPVLTLWDDLQFSVGGSSFDISSATIDFGSSEFRTPVRVFGSICKTCWWLIYYIALARLLRREYVYYTSLGHTEGAS